MAPRSLSTLATQVRSRASWSDVVHADRRAVVALQDLCREVRARETSADDVGATAVFLGATGSAATTAAAAVAGELGKALYRVDLAAVVSKWLGETEKHLAAVFDAAEVSDPVLLFDEADALFGKRTEVKDSHDRIVSLDLDHLLARLETYGGLAILATNRRTSAVGTALRRVPRVVEITFTPGRR